MLINGKVDFKHGHLQKFVPAEVSNFVSFYPTKLSTYKVFKYMLFTTDTDSFLSN